MIRNAFILGLMTQQINAHCINTTACNHGTDDAICEYTSCAGCIAPAACNYVATKTLNDGTCEYTSCAGCMDEAACNYDDDAWKNAACLFRGECDSCSGSSTDGTGTIIYNNIPPGTGNCPAGDTTDDTTAGDTTDDTAGDTTAGDTTVGDTTDDTTDDTTAGDATDDTTADATDGAAATVGDTDTDTTVDTDAADAKCPTGQKNGVIDRFNFTSEYCCHSCDSEHINITTCTQLEAVISKGGCFGECFSVMKHPSQYIFVHDFDNFGNYSCNAVLQAARDSNEEITTAIEEVAERMNLAANQIVVFFAVASAIAIGCYLRKNKKNKKNKKKDELESGDPENSELDTLLTSASSSLLF